MKGKNNCDLPPGFRFHPTDEELIIYYLQNQATSKPCPVPVIAEVNIYKFDPWELPEKAEFGEHEWYFFSPRDRKYRNGVRPNRATASGYWKATGTDKAIYSASKYVGVKKALVFYRGRPPKGVKTDWIMHEYRLNHTRKQDCKRNDSMRLDDCVLCRIYNKKRNFRNSKEMDPQVQVDETETKEQVVNLPRTCSLAHLLEFEQMGSISQLFDDISGGFNISPPNLDRQGVMSYDGGQFGHLPGNQSCLFKPLDHVDPTALGFQ